MPFSRSHAPCTALFLHSKEAWSQLCLSSRPWISYSLESISIPSNLHQEIFIRYTRSKQQRTNVTFFRSISSNQKKKGKYLCGNLPLFVQISSSVTHVSLRLRILFDLKSTSKYSGLPQRHISCFSAAKVGLEVGCFCSVSFLGQNIFHELLWLSKIV